MIIKIIPNFDKLTENISCWMSILIYVKIHLIPAYNYIKLICNVFSKHSEITVKLYIYTFTVSIYNFDTEGSEL